MQHIIQRFFTASALTVAVLATSSTHADVNSMTKIYHSPHTAPKVQRCKGDQNCNAFYALSKQWQAIPNNFRLHGFNIKADAKSGDGYGLWKGFSLKSERAITLAQAGDDVFFGGGSGSKADERIFAQGLAVLLYLDYKK